MKPVARSASLQRPPRLALGLAGGLMLAALLAAAPGAHAQQPCRGRLPDAKSADKGPESEKFRLIAQQCSVLDEPATLHRAAQLELYGRGPAPASVTIPMGNDPAPAAAPGTAPAPASAPPALRMLPEPRRAPVLDSHGRRVLAVAPTLLEAARAHGIDPLLMHAIAHVESRHNAGAVSPAGARGVMQVMPATGQRFGAGRDAERSLLDASTNTQAGAAYLRMLLRRYGDDLPRVLAAYNAGEGAVEKYGGVPPYAETQAYVREVSAVYRRLAREFSVSPAGEIVARLGSQP